VSTRSTSGRPLPIGLRALDGSFAVPGARWGRHASTSDELVLQRAAPPVLDIGCGPGRHVVALAEAGVPALGIDITRVALCAARARGALVLERSVFDRVPAAGRWGTCLLLDGNIGIGGDPASLLRRVVRLMRPGGSAIVELAPPGLRRSTCTVRLEFGSHAGPWFEWAQVAIDDVDVLASRAGAHVHDRWRSDDERWFATFGGPTWPA
jgi:SAM-dependent methyltransferase